MKITKEEAIKILSDVTKNRRGIVLTIVGERPVECYKGTVEIPTKRVSYQIQIGVNYENTQATKEAREAGREKHPALWKEYISPFVSRHKTNGTLYLEGPPVARRNSKSPVSVSFRLNGKRITRERAMRDALASEQSSSVGDWISYKLENIIRLNKTEI